MGKMGKKWEKWAKNFSPSSSKQQQQKGEGGNALLFPLSLFKSPFLYSMRYACMHEA